MFTLPQPPSSSEGDRMGLRGEGSTDKNPIHCQDSVDAFQALCWGLYAK